MAKGSKKDKILEKLDRIETLQKEMLKDWSFVEDFIFELTSASLKRDIRRGRKEYKAGKALPYNKVRTALGLA